MVFARRIARSDTADSAVHAARTRAAGCPACTLVFVFLSQLAESASILSLNAAFAAAAIAGAGFPSYSYGYGHALYGAVAGFLSRVHAVVDGEVATDHVGSRGGGVARQSFRCVALTVRAVLAVVDADDAGVTVTSQ